MITANKLEKNNEEGSSKAEAGSERVRERGRKRERGRTVNKYFARHKKHCAIIFAFSAAMAAAAE